MWPGAARAPERFAAEHPVGASSGSRHPEEWFQPPGDCSRDISGLGSSGHPCCAAFILNPSGCLPGAGKTGSIWLGSATPGLWKVPQTQQALCIYETFPVRDFCSQLLQSPHTLSAHPQYAGCLCPSSHLWLSKKVEGCGWRKSGQWRFGSGCPFPRESTRAGHKAQAKTAAA